jgi:hypothetical protein
MRRISRDAWLLVVLSLILVLMTVLAVISQTQELRQPPLSAGSNQPDGALALHLWLKELGYRVDADPQSHFQMPDRASVALLLQPTVTASDEELAQIDEWVRDGGVLILAGITPATVLVAEHFDFDLAFNPIAAGGLTGQLPVLNSPPQLDEVQGNFRSSWLAQESDYLVLFAERGSPVIVSTEVGEGLLIVSASAFPFSNKGLQASGNSQLALNVISAGGRPDLIWFDEWHHGLQAGAPAVSGPVDWLRQTPTGQALLYSVLVILAALALSGRSFGRPLVLQERRSRRPPVEYITAVANLSRRAGHRRAVLADYHYRLKRGLGYRYRLDPRLPDHEFVKRLATVDAAVDESTLTGLLARLNHPQPSEAQLVQLANEASEWIKET